MASKPKHDEMRDHYDFSLGVRGKYAARYEKGTSVVVPAPDVAEGLPDSTAVNEEQEKDGLLNYPLISIFISVLVVFLVVFGVRRKKKS